MRIDYIEVEQRSDGKTYECKIGVQFPDEPNELYEVSWRKSSEGWNEPPRLWFNGVDCKYSFKQSELAVLKTALQQWFTDHLLE